MGPSTNRSRGVLAAVFVLLLSACGASGSAQTGSSTQTAADQIGPSDIPDPAEVERALAQCLQDRGWSVDLKEGGGTRMSVPPGQDGAALEATEACQQELVERGITVDPLREPNDELVRLFYEQELALAECLDRNGLPTPPLPSWESFLDGFRGGEESMWSPMSEIHKAARNGDNTLREQAAADCPNDGTHG